MMMQGVSFGEALPMFMVNIAGSDQLMIPTFHPNWDEHNAIGDCDCEACRHSFECQMVRFAHSNQNACCRILEVKRQQSQEANVVNACSARADVRLSSET
jgi:hypothetical protein